MDEKSEVYKLFMRNAPKPPDAHLSEEELKRKKMYHHQKRCDGKVLTPDLLEAKKDET